MRPNEHRQHSNTGHKAACRRLQQEQSWSLLLTLSGSQGGDASVTLWHKDARELSFVVGADSRAALPYSAEAGADVPAPPPVVQVPALSSRPVLSLAHMASTFSFFGALSSAAISRTPVPALTPALLPGSCCPSSFCVSVASACFSTAASVDISRGVDSFRASELRALWIRALIPLNGSVETQLNSSLPASSLSTPEAWPI